MLQVPVTKMVRLATCLENTTQIQQSGSVVQIDVEDRPIGPADALCESDHITFLVLNDAPDRLHS